MGRLIPAPIVGQSSASGAQIINGSLKFYSNNDTTAATSQRLARTFGSAGDTQKMTMSVWVKRTIFTSSNTDSGTKTLFGAATPGNRDQIRFEHNASNRGDQLSIALLNDAASAVECFLSTGPVFRDPSAWYHIVWAIDTTQGTAANRVKLYVNGEQITDFSGSNTQPGQNFTINYFNNSVAHEIGRDPSGSNQAFDGYMSNFYWIDGQQLDSSYFGFTDPLTNTWRPKKYTGTYGTNGFYLPLDGNSPIGEDKSGNGNDFTPVNFSGSAAIDKATGALPILNTFGDNGKIALPSVRTDSSVGAAVTCVLALPLAGNANDLSNSVNSGSTTKTITNNSVTFSSTYQYLYGASGYFGGSAYLVTDLTSFNMNSDFTIEFWWYKTGTQTNNHGHFLGGVLGGTNSYGPTWRDQGDNDFQVTWRNTSSPSVLSISGGVALNEWHHYAFVYTKSDNSLRAYVDGVLKQTTTSLFSSDPGSWGSSSEIGRGGPGWSTQYVVGYVQDYRIYQGAKYTSNFIPASTDPDILPDTPSGVAGGSALTKITDGAVSFDGTGDSLVLTDNGDLHPGSGDFTLECFLYNRNISGERHYPIIQKGNTATNNNFDWRLYFNDSLNSTSHLWFDAACSGTDVSMGSGFTSMSTNRWYHCAVTRESGTFRVFLNGVLQGSNSSTTNAIDNDYTGVEIGFNDLGGAGDTYLDGYVSNVRFVKGTALYTANFTPPAAPLTNITNTTLLCCQSPSSATAAAVTPGSITANGNAAATNFNPFTTDIDAVRGQESGYCTLNPLNTGAAYTLSNGNLEFTSSANWDGTTGTFVVSSGKWYYEFTRGSGTSGLLGWCEPQNYDVTTEPGDPANSSVWRYRDDGTKRNGEAGGQSYGATWTTPGDVIGCALDLDAGTIVFYKNGISQGTAYSNLSGKTLVPVIGFYNCTAASSVNFGQKPFKYNPPEGFKTLCLANLPRPAKAAVRPDKYFNTVLYNGTSVTNNVTGVGFQPDFVWIKKRNAAEQHELQDSVRGATKRLASNLLASETTVAGSINSFDNDGFTVVDAGSTNENTFTYVGWAWKAGGNSGTFNIDGRGYATAAEAGLTAGTKASLLTGASVNTESGFSILTWTGDGAESNLFIPHGLPSLPKMVVIKKRNEAVDHWYVAHDGIQGTNYAYRMFWGPTKGGNLPDGTQATTDPYYLGTQSTNDTLLLGNTATYGGGNENNIQYVAYCWSEVPGFSKMGTYTGNGAVNGPLIECGFKPAWVMVKVAGGSVGNSWSVWDNKRDPVNEMNLYLHPNETQQDGSYSAMKMDFYSTGFKPRGNVVHQNSSGVKYIYTAFADVPTVNLYGGQANAR